MRLRRANDVLVISVVGEADLATERLLAERMRCAFDAAPPAVVLDVSGLAFFSAASVRSLARIAGDATHRGIIVAAVGVAPRLAWMWTMGEHSFPSQYASVEQAVAGLQAEVAGLRRAMSTEAAIERPRLVHLYRAPDGGDGRSE